MIRPRRYCVFGLFHFAVGSFQNLRFLFRHLNIADGNRNARSGGKAEAHILDVVDHFGCHSRAQMFVAAGHDVIDTLAVEQLVDKPQFFGQRAVKDNTPDSRLHQSRSFGHIAPSRPNWRNASRISSMCRQRPSPLISFHHVALTLGIVIHHLPDGLHAVALQARRQCWSLNANSSTDIASNLLVKRTRIGWRNLICPCHRHIRPRPCLAKIGNCSRLWPGSSTVR